MCTAQSIAPTLRRSTHRCPAALTPPRWQVHSIDAPSHAHALGAPYEPSPDHGALRVTDAQLLLLRAPSALCAAPSALQRGWEMVCSGVGEYFPGLPAYLGISANMQLPKYNDRIFSKSVWDILVAGVKGVANLVMAYPNTECALAGDLLLTLGDWATVASIERHHAKWARAYGWRACRVWRPECRAVLPAQARQHRGAVPVGQHGLLCCREYAHRRLRVAS